MRRTGSLLRAPKSTLSFGLFLAIAPLATFAGCGDDLGPVAGGSGLQGQPCEQESDCDDDNPCTVGFCFTGTCDIQPVASQQQPGAPQVDGDCLSINCKDGESVTEPDDNDPPEDDGADCMVPACSAGAVTQVPAEEGQFCPAGVCDEAGVCSCTPPTPDSPQFVDPIEGTDDPMHGGAPGACAYRTLTYALSQATGSIRMQPVEYSEATGETLPFVLTGSQRLRCWNDNEQAAATLSGNGVQGTSTATVAMTGAQNVVADCILVGGGADHCIVVTGDASAGDGHEIGYVSTSGCDNGVMVTGVGNGVYIHENTIAGNTTAGLAFSGGDKIGFIQNNTFSGNGTDITCSNPSPELGGDSNGSPTCTGCQNCPF